MSWTTIEKRAKKNNKAGETTVETVSQTPTLIGTIQRPTVTRPEVTNPMLFCVNCYQTHQDAETFDCCSVIICKNCQLPQNEKHKEDTCIAAVCTICKKRGHSEASCYMAPPPCTFCFERGHTIKECTKLADAKCKKCHQKGHTFKACPKRFTCIYCKTNGIKEHFHRMLTRDGNDIECQTMYDATQDGTYICGRCGNDNCWFDCKK